MGRELKRKQAKREGRNVKEVQIKKKEANELKPKSLGSLFILLMSRFSIFNSSFEMLIRKAKFRIDKIIDIAI